MRCAGPAARQKVSILRVSTVGVGKQHPAGQRICAILISLPRSGLGVRKPRTDSGRLPAPLCSLAVPSVARQPIGWSGQPSRSPRTALRDFASDHASRVLAPGPAPAGTSARQLQPSTPGSSGSRNRSRASSRGAAFPPQAQCRAPVRFRQSSRPLRIHDIGALPVGNPCEPGLRIRKRVLPIVHRPKLYIAAPPWPPAHSCSRS